MSKYLSTSFRLAIVLLSAIAFSGCSAKKRIADLEPTFLEDVDIQSKVDNLPFQHAWFDPDSNGNSYHSIFIKPVSVDRLTVDQWIRSNNAIITSKEDYITEAKEIAIYFHEQLVEQLKSLARSKWTILEQPNKDCLIVEIALTELEFSHPVTRAAALLVPVPGTGAAVGAVSDPHVAFAARISDAGSGKLLGTFADRKFPPARIIDLNKLTVSSAPREVVAIWSELIAEAFSKGRYVKTEGSSKFSLKPW